MPAPGLLMVRPAAFGFNPEAAKSNHFARAPSRPEEEAQAQIADAARREFDAYVELLVQAGASVTVLDDSPSPAKPDAVFPNNWVSFHEDGLAMLYPLAVASRRVERRLDVPHRRLVDLSPLEARGHFVEGTGSLVFDHQRRVAWAGLSPRTTAEGVARACETIGFAPRCFTASLGGRPVYHTNVYLAIGREIVAYAPSLVPAPTFCEGRQAVELTEEQVVAFAGNMLLLDGLVLVSAAGWAALSPPQRRLLERHGEVVRPQLPTIERVGGGSARCMVAEIVQEPAPTGPGAGL
ncbi:MAG: amidinotransferase [Deltaproteobacteria bacterium]|nr:amidinotransferase [Deltaproteobacteria bacterium]